MLEILNPDSAQAASLRSLALQLDRGVPVHKAFDLVYPEHKGAMKQGKSFSRVLPAAGILGNGEAELLGTFEMTGHLPQGLEQIAQAMQQRHATMRKLLGRMVLPFIIIQMAIPAFHIGFMIPPTTWDLSAIIISSLISLALVDSGLLLLGRCALSAWRNGKIEKWPLVGGWFLDLEKEKALAMLAAAHGGGLLWDDAFNRTSRALTSPTLKDRLKSVRHAITSCGEPGALIYSSLDLPPYCGGFLQSGDTAGELEKGLHECREALTRNAEFSRDTMVKGITTLMFVIKVIVVLAVIFNVFSAYLRLFSQIM